MGKWKSRAKPCSFARSRNLLDTEPVLEKQTTNPASRFTGDKSGYWGNIGIRLPNTKFSTWYPVTTSVMERIFSDLQQIEDESWILFQTLNNKMVLCRPSETQSFMFLDEADDEVEGDWDVDFDLEGLPEEIYECLKEFAFEDHADAIELEGFSPKLVSLVKDLIKEHQLDTNKIRATCELTTITFNDGTKRQLHVSPERLADVMLSFDLGIAHSQSKMLHLSDHLGARDVFLSLNSTSLIELPLIELKEGLKTQETDEDK
jgi:hypothetical protein